MVHQTGVARQTADRFDAVAQKYRQGRRFDPAYRLKMLANWQRHMALMNLTNWSRHGRGWRFAPNQRGREVAAGMVVIALVITDIAQTRDVLIRPSNPGLDQVHSGVVPNHGS
jgi:hypothetical protein